MSQKLICHQDKNVKKNFIVTKTEMSAKLKCHQNCNVMKTEMLPKMKCPQNQNHNPRDRH